MTIKVRVPNGPVCWVVTDDNELSATTDGALAPLSHCDDEGELNNDSFYGDSYAHLFPGKVMRYHAMICSWDELEVLDV